MRWIEEFLLTRKHPPKGYTGGETIFKYYFMEDEITEGIIKSNEEDFGTLKEIWVVGSKICSVLTGISEN